MSGQSLQRSLAGRVGVAPVIFGETKARTITVAAGAVTPVDLSSETEGWWELATDATTQKVTVAALAPATADFAWAALQPLPSALTADMAPLVNGQRRFFLPAGQSKLNIAHDAGGPLVFTLVKIFET